MKRHVFRAATRLALPTAVLAFVLVFRPGESGLALRIYALVVAAYALLLAIRALRRDLPPASPLRRGAGRRDERPRPPETLARLEQEVVLGVSSTFDLHYHLRPRLRALASEQLASRRGISLEQEPERAHAVLGDEAWGLVRSERPPPDDRLARGIAPADLSRIVASLERI